MSFYPAQNPFFMLTDKAGRPITGGRVYIGIAGMDPETNPTAVYWDDGVTPASQPLQVKGGYIVNGTSPAMPYTSASYSIRVYDALGAVVFYAASVFDQLGNFATELASDAGAALIGKTGGGDLQDVATIVDALAGNGGAAEVGHKYSGTGATKRTVAQVINDNGLNVFGFGAVGDNSTNDLAAFNACLTACKAVGARMIIPAGHTYKLDGGGSPIVWDPTKTRDGALRAVPIIGMGNAHAVLNVTNTGTDAGIQVYSTEQWFDCCIENLTIKGQVTGPLLTIGKNDYSDPVNMMSLRNVSVENSVNNAANEAVRLNYVAGGEAINLRANSYASGTGVNLGSALRLRQCEFVSFIGGAAGNATHGVDITDGVNFGLTFISQTYENVDYSFAHRSGNSGQHSVIGGQFSEVVQYPIYSSGILADAEIVFIGCNFTTTGALVDPDNYQGVRIATRRGVTPPDVPASTVTAANTTGFPVQVYVNGGNVTAYNINGEGARPFATNAYIPEILLPGETIALTYSVAPTWSWKNIGL